MKKPDNILPAPDALASAVQQEGEKFQDYYLWLQQAMPSAFFEEVSQESLFLITHSLIGFPLQDYFSTINLKRAAIVVCLDSPDADLKILHDYAFFGIKNYQAYVSKIAVPFPGINAFLRIAMINFTEAFEKVEKSYSSEFKQELSNRLKNLNSQITDQDFERLIANINPRFLFSILTNYQVLALNMLFKAQDRDDCQYEVRYEFEWEQKKSSPSSMHIVLAWRNTPRHHFLYRLARVIHRHGLSITRVNATYTNPYQPQSVLVMTLSLHGSNGNAVWEVADIPDFLRELITVKYFDTLDTIDDKLVSRKIISGNMGNLLRVMVNFIHQVLVHVDSNLYILENIEEALCRHPELTMQLCAAFKCKFDPNFHQYERFLEIKKQFLEEVTQLDTGQEENDTRRKNVLQQGMNFITHCLKTNFYTLNYTALSFRLDPVYLSTLSILTQKFPELPYAIFFMRGMHFFGFHIRFKDLARGGLRTIYSEQYEQMITERNHVFTECYNLAWTQQQKNKDIPEGGSKGVILLTPFTQIDAELQILKKELERSLLDPIEIEHKLNLFRREQKMSYLYQAQRNYIESLITLVNCEPDGKLRAKSIIDYWRRPEYLYLGPDENMHDSMIQWIADYSQRQHYKPGRAFISSKPIVGINHKEYGVTSLGVNVYMQRVLEFLGIQPEKDIFTVKLSGGPDGDVAGNQLLNLYRYYPHTAKVLALTDKTGTIHDPQGLDLSILKDLFYEKKGIHFYPPEKLHPGGFLVDKETKRYPTAYTQETLCLRKYEDKLIEDWLSGNDTNHLLHYNVHQTKTDVFIPAGGRPRTLNETNIKEFLDEIGRPTARAIIEGANLYLTPEARQFLETKGVLIIKDSSANKTGVICSSFEVLCGLALDEKTFLAYKPTLIAEILNRLKECAESEADLLLRTYKQTGEPLTFLSDKVSQKINQYTYQLLNYLELIPTPSNSQDPLVLCFLNYCLPTLREKFTKQLLEEIPDHHKKAIISCYLSAHTVYKKGINWSPSIVDILPLILSETSLLSEKIQHSNI